MKKYIKQLTNNQDLTTVECRAVIDEIANNANPYQIAAFAVLLHAKQETADELFGLVQGMQELMIKVPVDEDLLDIVGTGGDAANTVNISSAASIVAASCGAKVAKHGNRSVSSKSGSADVFEKLGININLSKTEIVKAIQEYNFAFCYGPNFHPVLQKLSAIRRGLGVRTTFNLLGPLLNPAQAKFCLLGVCDKKYLKLYAQVLQKLNIKHALVVHGCGLDELNLLGPADVIEIKDGNIESYQIDPKEFGFEYCELKDLQGGDATANATIIVNALQGQQSAIADTIALNAGAGLYVAGKTASIKEGVEKAKLNMTNGMALDTLNKLQMSACHA